MVGACCRASPQSIMMHNVSIMVSGGDTEGDGNNGYPFEQTGRGRQGEFVTATYVLSIVFWGEDTRTGR